MIKIKKLYIENFKGISTSLVIDFSNDKTSVNILAGPNGFGKTTIFDAIEICLTGQFYRVMNLFDRVQKKNANRNKPFFQNEDERDVILKLWVENSATKKSTILIKHYDDVNSPNRVKQGRENIPSDSNNFFTTYLTDDTSFFDLNDFSTLSGVKQEEIDEIIYGDNSLIKLRSTYYLFNYLQQEDSIYFLRQDEDEKGDSLGFLFNIQGEEEKKEKLNRICIDLGEKYSHIYDAVQTLKTTLSSAKDIEFIKLFPEKEFDFDKELPFKDVPNPEEKLNQVREEVNSLIEFKEKFSPSEFEKSLRFNKINRDIVDNSELLESFVLSKIYSTELIEKTESNNKKIAKGREFKEKKDKVILEKTYFDLFLIDNGDDDYKEYVEIFTQIQAIDKDLGEIGKVISDLNTSREKSIAEFTKLSNEDFISESNCPLCDTAFPSYQELIRQVSEKTKQLNTYSTSKLESKKELTRKALVFAAKIELQIDSFLKDITPIRASVLSKFRAIPNFEEKLVEIIEEYPEIATSETQELYFVSIPRDETAIQEKVDQARKFLREQILPKYQFNSELLYNKQHFTDYFDKDAGLLKAITIELLKAKLEYLTNHYNVIASDKLRFLEDRLKKLNKIKDAAQSVLDKVKRSIKNHKHELIGKIKIPFFVYSGKILQSYQQGLGIFIEIHQTGLSNNVRFKTGHNSDHDIVYHLSSGQMVVAAIAFCLSLNKVYSTNQNFKFLAIDDPIQSMDDLNVHTFIELIRHEFADYQIIISTHDDFNSRYLKYKLDKFELNTDIQNVQDKVLEQYFN